MMQKPETTKRQLGFFDPGLALLILALGGGVAVAANHADSKKTELHQQQAETTLARESNTPKIAVIKTENPTETVQ